MNPTIIGFNTQTNSIAIGLKAGCLTVDDTATLDIWEQACTKYLTTIVNAGCGLTRNVVSVAPNVKISLQYSGKDSDGRAIFLLPQAIKDSANLYWAGEMVMCGRKVKISLQRHNSVSISSTATSFITGYVDFIVGGIAVGKVGILSAGCLSVPKGWVAMRNPLTGALVGYAPLNKGDGFCKPYTQTSYGCSNVWLA